MMPSCVSPVTHRLSAETNIVFCLIQQRQNLPQLRQILHSAMNKRYVRRYHFGTVDFGGVVHTVCSLLSAGSGEVVVGFASGEVRVASASLVKGMAN